MRLTARPFSYLPRPFKLASASVAAAALCFLAEPASAAPADPGAVLPGQASAVAALAAHANGEHPAVRVARMARRVDGHGIDPNTFIVQPPAPVRWTLGSEADPAMQLAAGAGTAAAGRSH